MKNKIPKTGALLQQHTWQEKQKYTTIITIITTTTTSNNNNNNNSNNNNNNNNKTTTTTTTTTTATAPTATGRVDGWMLVAKLDRTVVFATGRAFAWCEGGKGSKRRRGKLVAIWTFTEGPPVICCWIYPPTQDAIACSDHQDDITFVGSGILIEPLFVIVRGSTVKRINKNSVHPLFWSN